MVHFVIKCLLWMKRDFLAMMIHLFLYFSQKNVHLKLQKRIIIIFIMIENALQLDLKEKDQLYILMQNLMEIVIKATHLIILL